MEDATTYLVDHPAEHTTAEDLINRFTDIQDEHDYIMDEFRHMPQENSAETTLHTADSVQQQPILDRDSSQTSTLSGSSHQPGSSPQQTLGHQNSSNSREFQEQIPQTGFEINRPQQQIRRRQETDSREQTKAS